MRISAFSVDQHKRRTDTADSGILYYRVAQEIAAVLRTVDVPTDVINLFLTNGMLAGREVFHVHLYVIPRTEDDDMRLDALRNSPDRDELNGLATDIM
jgi:histidine triad (HIT) family protein